MKRSARDLVAAFAQREAALRDQVFLAPLIGDGRARVRVAGLLYELRARAPHAGWWLCRMRDAAHAEVFEAAQPYQRGDYLALWPELRVVLLEPLRHGAWLALPYNPADAAQRFAIAWPAPVHLVEGGQPFERAIARVEGGTLWFDDLDRRADPLIAEQLRAALAAAVEELAVPNLSPGEQAAYLLRRYAGAPPDRLAQQLGRALHMAGARLIGYSVEEYGIRVEWERAGERSVSLVDPGLNVVSAGICLSGEDRQFDLTSLVGVVRDAPDFAR